MDKTELFEALTELQKINEELTTRQLTVLVDISRRNGIIGRELADNAGLTATSVTRIVDQFEEAGLVKRREVYGDRRMKFVFTTELGDKVVDSLI